MKKRMGVMLERLDGKFYVVSDYAVFELNEVGARVLELCNGENDVEAIVRKLNSHYSQIEPEELRTDVFEYINVLLENELIKEVR